MDIVDAPLWPFLILTVVIFGGAAAMTGEGLARGWRSAWQPVGYALLLALGDRFLLYALFDGELLSVSGFLAAFAILALMALLAHRITQVRAMVTQYPWLYERAGLFSWRERADSLTGKPS